MARRRARHVRARPRPSRGVGGAGAGTLSRVLLTGASGFLGREALTALLARGHEVHAVARRPPAANDFSVRWHASDLLAPGAGERLMQVVRPELLLHLAWCTAPGAYWESPENARWLEASRTLLKAFTACGGRRAVVTGTCAEYDWAHAGAPLSERLTPVAPRTRYGKAKDALRREVERLSSTGTLSAAWARMFFLFGPREHPSRLVPSVTLELLQGRAAPCTEGGQVRDYLASAPAGRALTALLESSVRGPVNVASGRGTSVRELVELVARAAGRPDLPRFGAVPSRPEEPPSIVADVTRLEQEVGWRAPDGLEEDVNATVGWWRAEGRV